MCQDRGLPVHTSPADGCPYTVSNAAYETFVNVIARMLKYSTGQFDIVRHMSSMQHEHVGCVYGTFFVLSPTVSLSHEPTSSYNTFERLGQLLKPNQAIDRSAE